MDLERLQKLHNRAMRAILKCSIYTRIDVMLQSLNWMNICDFLKYNVLCFLHKIKVNAVPDYLKNILIKFDEIHEHDTRSKQNFVVKRARKSSTHCSIFYKGVVEYNRLSNDLKATSMKVFKRSLKMYFLQRR